MMNRHISLIVFGALSLLSLNTSLKAAKLDDLPNPAPKQHTQPKRTTQKEERDAVLKTRDEEMRRIEKMSAEQEGAQSVDYSNTAGKSGNPPRPRAGQGNPYRPANLQDADEGWKAYKPSSDPFGLTKNMPVTAPPGGDEVDQFMVPFAVNSANGGFKSRKSRTVF